MKTTNISSHVVLFASLFLLAFIPANAHATLSITKVAEKATAPYASGVAVSHDDTQIFVAVWEDQNDSRVLRYNLPGLSLIQTFSFGPQHTHGDVVLSADSTRFFTQNYYWSTVSQINMAAANNRTDQPSVQSWPGEIDITPDRSKVVVSAGQDGSDQDLNNDGVTLYNIGAGAFSLIGFVPLPDEICSKKLGFSPDSQFAYVPTRPRKSALPRVYEVSLSGTPAVTRYIEINAPALWPLPGVACAGNVVYVSDYGGNKIWAIDRTSWTATSHAVPSAPATMAMHPDGRHLFVVLRDAQSILAIDTQTMTTVGQYDALEDYAHDIEFGSAGAKMYVQHRNATGSLMVFDIGQAPVGDLVAHYPLDNDVSDVTGNGNDGTPVNQASFVQAGCGGALSLDGVDDYVILPSGIVGGLSAGTFSVWVNMRSFPRGGAQFASQGQPDCTHFYLAAGQKDGHITAAMCGGVGGVRYLGGAPILELNTWAMVSFTWDGSFWNLYVNGGLYTNTPAINYPAITSDTFKLGRHEHISGPYMFDGLMDDVRIYNRALKQTELMALYQESCATNSPAVVQCPGAIIAECGKPVLVRAEVSDPDGDALVCVWSVNGALVQTNFVPAAPMPPIFVPRDPPVLIPLPPLMPPLPPTELTPPELDPATSRVDDPLILYAAVLFRASQPSFSLPALEPQVPGILPPPPTVPGGISVLTLRVEDLPLGTNVVTVAVSDGVNPPVECSTLVIVEDLQPPVVVRASAMPNVLSPPNHKMVLVKLNARVRDACGPTTWKIRRIQCSEPDHAASDIRLVNDHEVALRAARSGKSGEGRVYTIWLQAEDGAGNVSRLRPVSVTVPHDQRGR